MNPTTAAAWLRMDSDDKERTVADTFTAPSWTQIKTEVARRDDEAMELVLSFVEQCASPWK